VAEKRKERVVPEIRELLEPAAELEKTFRELLTRPAVEMGIPVPPIPPGPAEMTIRMIEKGPEKAIREEIEKLAEGVEEAAEGVSKKRRKRKRGKGWGM